MSTTPPGAIKLISNHYKLRVKNSGEVSLYSIDFGETIQRNDAYRMKEAVGNCAKKLQDIIGRFIYHSGHIFAMTGQVG